MFTGIIECLGRVVSKKTKGSNVMIGVRSELGNELQIDQSLSHNGVCLTVVKSEGVVHFVTAVEETLLKSNLSDLEVDSNVNLERAMLNNGRFDGHVVQGHVDGTATCHRIEKKEGSWIFTFKPVTEHKGLIVEKGSICVNGVSLTCFDVTRSEFTVAIIPYTFDHTTFSKLTVNDRVNIEFDVIGKYVRSIISYS